MNISIPAVNANLSKVLSTPLVSAQPAALGLPLAGDTTAGLNSSNLP